MRGPHLCGGPRCPSASTWVRLKQLKHACGCIHAHHAHTHTRTHAHGVTHFLAPSLTHARTHTAPTTIPHAHAPFAHPRPPRCSPRSSSMRWRTPAGAPGPSLAPDVPSSLQLSRPSRQPPATAVHSGMHKLRRRGAPTPARRGPTHAPPGRRWAARRGSRTLRWFSSPAPSATSTSRCMLCWGVCGGG
jgi:hypothetical protein